MAAMLLEQQQQQMELARQQQEQVGPAPRGGHLQAQPGVWGALLSRAGIVGSVGQAWLAQAEATGGWGGGHRKGLGFPPLGVHQSLQEDQGGGCWGALSESSQLLPGL